MARLDDFVQLVHENSRDEFAAKHPKPFLILYIDKTEADEAWSFKTTTISSKRINIARMLDEDGVSLSKDAARYRVFPMVKTAGNPWPERISVGRAKDAGVRMVSGGVSRRHAIFELRESVWYVKDLGSSNGTYLNGDRITLAEIRPRDMIMFGCLESVIQIRAVDPPPRGSMDETKRDVMFGPQH